MWRPALATGFNRPSWFPGDPINLRGLFLFMSDGAEWFHPFDGRDPREVIAS